MKSIFRLAYLLTCFLFCSCNASGQQEEAYIARIDSLLKITHPRTFNGVVFIQQNGKVKYAKAYGYADFEKMTPLKISGRFSTMSIAKQITATLIMQEVEKGTLDLHVPVRRYLPDFKYSWADTVTLHHLLNHTSGLNSESMDEPLKFAAGKAFSYSNIGYSLAGQILEKQTHKSFEQLVTALFKKCGMKNSSYPMAAAQNLLTKGHTIQKDKTARMNPKVNFAPAHCFGSHLVVTAGDLAKWNECLHRGKLLKPATYTLMTTYTMTNAHQLFGEAPVGYGYGLRINDKDSVLEIGHTGFHPAEGFTAVNLYYPQSNTSVIVMENQANENFDIAYYFEQQVRAIVKSSSLLK